MPCSNISIAIFTIAVAGVAVIPFEKDLHQSRIIVGTIINKNIGLVTVASREHPGQILTLSTNPKAENMTLLPGEQIIVEYGPNYIIQSMTKPG